MSDRDDLHRHGPAVAAMSLERRRVCRWLLLPAAQFLVPSMAWANVARIASARMWPAQEYTRVVLAQSEALIRTPLKDLVAELDPDRFWQIHRSTIVNVSQLAGVLREDAERQFALFKSRPDKLPISRQFTHLFKQM